ncbi:MAG TPA: hypothetical protein VGR73_17330 [Bryobacteraceae bacterium]|nr:hypothetical protein [Bryobacteraceae bacterium]
MQKALRCAVFVFLEVTARAQWLNYRAAGTPATPDGKVNLSAPAPRAPDGKPDLTGVWHLQTTRQEASLTGVESSVEEPGPSLAPAPGGGSYTNNIFRDMPPADVPETPAGAKLRAERMKSGTRPNPSVFCLPMGIPVNNFVIEVVKFIQAPKEIVVIHEVDGSYRQIYTDGRPLPKDMSPSWLGYSTAHWDGDTLVVETEGFNDRTWLDMIGHSHSEALRLTERYRRRDYGHMDVEMTFNDPVMYARPFTIRFTHALIPDSDILEAYCNENEKDRAHIQGLKEVPAK